VLLRQGGRVAVVECDLARLEDRLDSLDLPTRWRTLLSLQRSVEDGRLPIAAAGDAVNLHCHTFFSYNAYGYSPAKFAWLARRAGLGVAGIVDFDVLDGLDEFLRAGGVLGLKTCAGLETRVFLPEFSADVTNSPGEPGICYHLGLGFPGAELPPDQADFLSSLRRTGTDRNRELLERANQYLQPLTVDYDRDVLPLTPSGNATERHICLAYVRGARALFADDGELADFWGSKIGATNRELGRQDSVELQSLIRSVTMKAGGVACVAPDSGSFPRMAEASTFIAGSGGIPAYAWLDGTSDGERRLEDLLAVVMDSGVEAINIVPDRNYTPGVKDERLANLHDVVQHAEELHLPVVVGTEMNSPGQKFVDDFRSEELAPIASVFRRGALIVYAHSVLQRGGGLGYMSAWARRHFGDRAARNQFYEHLGLVLEPAREDTLKGLDETVAPDDILARAAG
jgi:hypothetical protein